MSKQLLLFVLIQLAISHIVLFQVEDISYQDIEEVFISTAKEKKIYFEAPKSY